MTAMSHSDPAASALYDKVVFLDEFNAATLDRSKWNVEGPAFWVNNEVQAYVDSAETIRLLPAGSVDGASGGVLELRTVYQPGFKTPSGRLTDFVSGRIDTRDKFDFTHGRAAARVRMPALEGVWPAFWLLGNGEWPDTGEIDILEYVGEKDWTGVAVHGPGYSGDTPLVNKYFFPPETDATDWHVYAVEWDEEKIIFTIDDRVIYRVTREMVGVYGDWKFDTPKHMILNLALGGEYPRKTNAIDKPGYGLPAAAAELIQREGVAIQIDWVKVTQAG
ncbi:glycoside hydrolase family 16 protein [Maricaulis sp.]|uniref:glycoside hydrolase family 16 protein n=1 Tax=Maricaulis sp. TaxID=1486257 RepID=UPI00261E269A|nr:glycoside hydrolase family 16 protein [Maricaulis sp.]